MAKTDITKTENKKELMDVFKHLFSLTKKFAFKNETLQDGVTQIQTDADDFSVGSKVSTVTADGTLSAIADGPITLSDGSVLDVKDGIVATVTPGTGTDMEKEIQPEDEMDPKKVKAKEAKKNKDDKKDEEIPETMEGETKMDPQMIADILSNLVDKIKQMSDKQSSMDTQCAKMSAQIEKFAGSPGAPSVTEQKKIELSEIDKNEKPDTSFGKLVAYRKQLDAEKVAAQTKKLEYSKTMFSGENPLFAGKKTKNGLNFNLEVK